MSIYDQLYGIPAMQPNPLDQQQAYTPQGVVPDSLYQGAMNTAQATPSPMSQLSPLESQLSSLMNNRQGMMEALGYSPTEIAMINQAPTPDAANEVRNFIAQRQAGEAAQAKQYAQQQALASQKIGSEEKQSAADIASREKIAQAELNQRNQAARADQLGEWLKSRAAMGAPPTPAEMDAFNKYLEKAFPTNTVQSGQQQPTQPSAQPTGSQIKTKTVDGKTVYYNEPASAKQSAEPSADAAYKEVMDAYKAQKVSPQALLAAISAHPGWSPELKKTIADRFSKENVAPTQTGGGNALDAYAQAKQELASKPATAKPVQQVAAPSGLEYLQTGTSQAQRDAVAAEAQSRDKQLEGKAKGAAEQIYNYAKDQGSLQTLQDAVISGKYDQDPFIKKWLASMFSISIPIPSSTQAPTQVAGATR